MRTIREEVFGPHVAIVPFENDQQAIRIYNDTPYGLSMAVITEDYRRWRLFRDECDYGMGYVNLPCIGAEVHLPFGGVKRSGNGQPSAAALVDAVTHKIAFTVNYDRKITMAQGMSAQITDEKEAVVRFQNRNQERTKSSVDIRGRVEHAFHNRHDAERIASGPADIAARPQGRGLDRADDQVLSPSYTRAYPLVAARGNGCTIEDIDGNLFLDFTAGIAVTATGHCHPEVMAAIIDQAGKLIHMSGTDFYYTPEIEIAERLARLARPDPKRVFFTNSGAESVEAALELARFHTGRQRMISCHGAFHGRTLRRHVTRRIESDPSARVRAARCPACIAYPFNCDQVVFEEQFHTVCPPDEVAAIFVEPIQGEGGYRLPDADFLPMLGASATNMESCSWRTKCSRAWGARARCSPSSILTSRPTWCAWPRDRPAVCHWGRSWPRRN